METSGSEQSQTEISADMCKNGSQTSIYGLRISRLTSLPPRLDLLTSEELDHQMIFVMVSTPHDLRSNFCILAGGVQEQVHHVVRYDHELNN